MHYNISNTINIGTTTNILQGLNASWDPNTPSSSLVTKPPSTALKTSSVSGVDQFRAWQSLVITLHSSPEAVLSTLIPLGFVTSANDKNPATLPTGSLFRSGFDALSDSLGVPLSPAYGYMLASYVRKDDEQTHASVNSMKAFKPYRVFKKTAKLSDPAFVADPQYTKDVKALPYNKSVPFEEQMQLLSVDDANQYLDLFNTWGTHYVSSVYLGDQIFQVFAYSKDNFQRILDNGFETENPIEGDVASSMIQFTTPAAITEYGYVDAYGTLCCLSADPNFTSSVANNDWKEELYSNGQNSIFTSTDLSSKVSFEHFNTLFMTQTVSKTLLAPMDVYCTDMRTKIWMRVYKAALYTVYRDTVDPNLPPLDTRDFKSILPDDQPGVASTLPTPSIDVYKVFLDLADIQMFSPDLVETFMGVSYVSSAKGSFSLPGSTLGLYCGIFDANENGQPNMLTLSAKAFSNFTVACSIFLGALIVQPEDKSASFTISDGLKYEVSTSGSPRVVLSVRTQSPLDIEVLTSMKTDFHFALTFAGSVLNVQQPDTTKMKPDTDEIVREFMKWITVAIPKTVTDKELLEIRIRALVYSSFVIDTMLGTNVPALKGEVYEDYINKLMDSIRDISFTITTAAEEIAERKRTELIIDDLSTINENIIQTGNMLAGFIDQSAQQRAAMSEYLSSSMEAMESSLESNMVTVDKLQVELAAAQLDFENEVQNFKKAAVDAFESKNNVFQTLEFALQIFALGALIVLPGAGTAVEVAEFATMAQQVQATVNAFNSMQQYYKDMDQMMETMRQVQSTLDDLAGGDFGPVSSLPWKNMNALFDYIMDTVPTVLKTEAAAVKLKFDILENTGEALVAAEASLQLLQMNIYEKEQQSAFLETQANELEELTAEFDPSNIETFDPCNVDLIGMTSMLCLQRDIMLSDFAGAFLIQDQALQYEYLQEPTIISDYSILNFDVSRSAQAQKTIGAKTKLVTQQSSTTDNIFTKTSVFVEKVTKGCSYHFRILPDDAAFNAYAYCRVLSVIPEVQGVNISSSSGKYALRLRFGRVPFLDVDLTGKSSVFHTSRREKTYEFNKDGSPCFDESDGMTWSTDATEVTPFGTWSIDFPEVQMNDGLQFDALSFTVKLKFKLQHYLRSGGGASQQKSGPKRISKAGKSRAIDDGTQTSGPMRSALISDMFIHGTVTNGWDIVFNMEVNACNKAIAQQHGDMITDGGFDSHFSATTETQVSDPRVLKLYFEDVFYDCPVFANPEQMSPDVHFPITGGKLVQSTQVGDDPPFLEKIDITGYTLVDSMNPIYNSAGGTYTYDFGDKDISTLSWLGISTSINGNGDVVYVIDGVTILETDMNGFFDSIIQFFGDNNISLVVPTSMVVPETDIDGLNEIFRTYYDETIMSLAVKNQIVAEYERDTPAQMATKSYDMDLGAPLLQFDNNETNEVNVSFEILNGIISGPDIAEQPFTGTFSGKADLNSITGDLESNSSNSNIQTVVLDLAAGTYQAGDLSIEINADEQAQLAEELTTLFVTNDVKYIINKMDFTNVAVLPDMCPNQFIFRQRNTPDGVQLLILLIQTNDRTLLADDTINITEPLPAENQASIFIRSELFFDSILPVSLDNGWTATGVETTAEEDGGNHPWMGRMTRSEVTATNVDLSDADTHTQSSDYGGNTKHIYDWYYVDNDTITIDLGDNEDDYLNLKPRNQSGLQLKGEKTHTITVQHHHKETTSSMWGTDVDADWTEEMPVELTTTTNGVMELSLSGSGMEQSLSSTMTAQDVTATGVTDEDNCGNPTVEAQITNDLMTQVPPQIESQLTSLSFQPISLFAIKNILFYKQNYIDMEMVAGPSDIAIFGNFSFPAAAADARTNSSPITQRNRTKNESKKKACVIC